MDIFKVDKTRKKFYVTKEKSKEELQQLLGARYNFIERHPTVESMVSDLAHFKSFLNRDVALIYELEGLLTIHAQLQCVKDPCNIEILIALRNSCRELYIKERSTFCSNLRNDVIQTAKNLCNVYNAVFRYSICNKLLKLKETLRNKKPESEHLFWLIRSVQDEISKRNKGNRGLNIYSVGNIAHSNYKEFLNTGSSKCITRINNQIDPVMRLSIYYAVYHYLYQDICDKNISNAKVNSSICEVRNYIERLLPNLEPREVHYDGYNIDYYILICQYYRCLVYMQGLIQIKKAL